MVDLTTREGAWGCICQACFAFTGTEVVGMTFGETPNPSDNELLSEQPRNLRALVSLFDRSWLGPELTSHKSDASPFVVAVSIADISVFPVATVLFVQRNIAH